MTDPTPPRLYVQWSDDGAHIRKWSGEPFEGGAEYAAVPAKAWGCHVDLFDGDTPDSCVITSGDYLDCIHANPGMQPCDCKYWREYQPAIPARSAPNAMRGGL